ncbi:MAG: hypothetical protein NW215_08975 [Hyphomicrobiales bacterium]|nr:hypothetical protein [Hyphomicrobiales bacterium]
MTVLSKLLCVLVVAAASPVFAQPADAPPPVRALFAADLRAEVTDSGQSRPHALGSSAFASVRIKRDGVAQPTKGKRKPAAPGLGGAQLLLAVEHGEIVGVTGEGLKTEADGPRSSVALPALRPGEETTVLIEVRLKPAETAANALKITLKTQDAASDHADLRWSVRDCAGDYYRELQTIAGEGGAELSKVLADIRKPAEELKAPAVFRSAAASRSSGRCVRYKRQWNPYEFGYSRVCVRYAAGEAPPTPVPGELSREDREALTRANALIRNGGADAKLARNGPLGWVSGKIAEDMRLYLTQPQHPALCTGAPQITAYYLKQSGGVKSHAEGVIALAAKVRVIAAAKAEEAKRAVEALRAGTTSTASEGEGSAPIRVVHAPSGGDDLRGLILALAEAGAAANAEAGAKIAAMDDELAMLAAVKEQIESGVIEKPTADALRPALALIESAARMDVIRQRHEVLRTKFIGAIERVRGAYDKHCVCRD